MSDIFAEVDEIMHQERLKAIWDKYGNIIIAILVSIILLTAAHSGYKAWDTYHKESQTSALNALLDDETFPENLDINNTKLKGDVKAIAFMAAARTYLEQEEPDIDNARAFYAAVSEDSSVSDTYANLAALMASRLILQDGDTQNAKAILEETYKEENNLWRYHAALELAVIEADEKNYTKAIEYLDAIISAEVIPPSLLNRANSLRHVYELKNK